jgi:hypothetical protein
MTQSTLDQPAVRLLHASARGDLNRLLVATQRATGKTYLDTYNEYAKGVGDGSARTAGAVVAGLGADVRKVATEMRVLEAADTAQHTLNARAAELMTLEAEGAASPAADPGSFTSPEAEISRFTRANRVTSVYSGPEGFEKFRRDNRQMALAGRDLVVQLEQPVAQQHAAAILERHARTVANVANGDGDAGTRIRALSQLTSDGIRTLEQQLAPQASTGAPSARGSLRLLEQPDPGADPHRAASGRALDLMNARGESGADAYLRLLQSEGS